MIFVPSRYICFFWLRGEMCWIAILPVNLEAGYFALQPACYTEALNTIHCFRRLNEKARKPWILSNRPELWRGGVVPSAYLVQWAPPILKEHSTHSQLSVFIRCDDFRRTFRSEISFPVSFYIRKFYVPWPHL